MWLAGLLQASGGPCSLPRLASSARAGSLSGRGRRASGTSTEDGEAQEDDDKSGSNRESELVREIFMD